MRYGNFLFGLSLFFAMPALAAPKWETYMVHEKRKILFIKAEGVENAVSYIEALRKHPSVARTLFEQADKSTHALPLGKQPTLETAIDASCDRLNKGTHAFRGIGENSLKKQFPVPYRVEDKKRPETVPYSLEKGALLSSMVLPAETSRPGVVGAVITCEDPPGKRFEYAQNRAYMSHIVYSTLAASRALRMSLKKSPNQASRATLLKLTSKINRFASEQLKRYTPVYDWQRQEIESLSRMLASRANRAAKTYAKHREKNKKAYPPLKENDLSFSRQELNLIFGME